MIRKVQKTIDKHAMFQTKDRIIVGISGGADSCALLSVLVKLKAIYDFELFAVHINHGIRGEEANGDEKFVEKLCLKFNVPFKAFHVDCIGYAAQNKISVEQAARDLRYDCFYKAADKFNAAKIAVAHNVNDQAETILMRLLRGSSGLGLRGMDALHGRIVRPLLECTRLEIETYLKENNVNYVTDSTNSSMDYTRNNVRHTLLPLVEAGFNPNIVNTLVRTGKMLGDDAGCLHDMAMEAFDQYVVACGHGLVIKKHAIENLHKAICSRLIRICVKKINGTDKDFSNLHTELIYDCFNLTSGKTVTLIQGICAQNMFGDVVIYKNEMEKLQEKILHHNDFFHVNDEVGFMSISFFKPLCKENYINTCTGDFNYDKMGKELLLRYRKPGDYVQTNHQKATRLKDYLIEKRIPQFLRDSLLLVAQGSHVLWVLDGANKKAVYDEYGADNNKIYIQLWRAT